MSSIFAKGRVIALASVHSLLDATTETMSIPVLRQHIRDLEAARENMEGQLVEQRESLRRAIERAAVTARKIGELTVQAKLLKAQGKTESALALAGEINTLEASTTNAALIQQMQDTVTSFEGIVGGLRRKEQKMKVDLERLSMLDSSARNAERAASAIKNAAGAVDIGSIDNLAEKIENRAAKANGQLEAAMGTLNSGVDKDVERAKAEARLAAL